MTERGELQDKVLTCVDCKQEFTWDAGAQAFFKEKGLTNEPKHCKKFHQANKHRRAGQKAGKGAGT